MKVLKTTGRYFLIYSVVLIYLECILRSRMNGGITGNFLFFLCFIPAQAFFLTLFNGFFSDRKNMIVSSILLFLLEVYYIAQLIYYKNFGSLFSASMAGMGAEAVGNFGWTLKGVILGNLGWIFLMLLPVLLIGGLSFFRLLKQEKISLRPRLVMLLLVLPLWFLGVQVTRLDGTERQSAYVVYHDMLSDTDNTAAHLGALTTTILEFCSPHFTSSSSDALLSTVDMDILLPPGNQAPEQSQNSPASDPEQPGKDAESLPPEEIFIPEPQIFEEIDLKHLAEQTEDAKIKELCLYLDNRGATDTNKYTGIFEGYNLIYICAEAFWTYAIDEQVTPTLYKMANQGILLNNYYNSFRNTTTNGEYAFLTSLWPDLSRRADSGTDAGSFAQSAKCFMPMGPGNLFQSVNVPSYAFHNYYGEYYRRYLSWPNLGYTCKFSGTGMKFTSDWPASDLELMEQSVDDYIGDDRFHAYYMTFSGHGPYTYINAVSRKNIDFVRENMEEGHLAEVYNYLAGSRELDKAMEYLLQRLEEAGKLENTVIVIAGDHYPYNLSQEAANDLVGHELDTDFELYQSTCIIYNAGMEENIVTDAYCSNVDILPTILNLFGIKFDSRLMMGRDIFAEGLHKAVTYNKSFITDLVRYNRKTGKTVWSDAAENYSDEQKKEYLEKMINLVDSEFLASTQILNLNFYRYAWYNSGLMTEEELAAEKQRAAEVQNENARYNEYLREQEEAAAAAAAAAQELEEQQGEIPPEQLPDAQPKQEPQPDAQE